MMQRGDKTITMWARRTANAVESIERMFKAFLTDAQIRQVKMMEALLEGGRAKGAGKRPVGDQVGDDPKLDWKGASKGWLAKLAPLMLVGLVNMFKNLFSEDGWAEEAGMEDLSKKLGKMLGGSREGGWLNAILQAGSGSLAGFAVGATSGFLMAGPVGAIAGGLIGAIVGAIAGAVMGWFGSEHMTRIIDAPLKAIRRVFGLANKTTEEDIKLSTVD